MPALTRPAAVLDLDGTLHPRTLGGQVLRELLRDGAAPQGPAHAALAAIDGRAGTPVSFRTTVDEVYTGYTAAVAGLPHPMLVQAARRAWHAERHAVFDFVAPLLHELALRDHILVLISGSPHELIEEAADDLGIPHRFGARVAVAEGHCLARLERAPGYPGEKIRCLTELAAHLPIDLSRSIALGNSASDIEILTAVGAPVAFEPDQELSAAAQRHGWSIADRGTALELCLNTITSALANRPPLKSWTEPPGSP